MYYESCYWNVRKTCTIYVNMKYYYQPYPRETELLFGINVPGKRALTRWFWGS
jgi:hypothetical protein